jgi:hypothetical protein
MKIFAIASSHLSLESKKESFSLWKVKNSATSRRLLSPMAIPRGASFGPLFDWLRVVSLVEPWLIESCHESNLTYRTSAALFLAPVGLAGKAAARSKSPRIRYQRLE